MFEFLFFIRPMLLRGQRPSPFKSYSNIFVSPFRAGVGFATGHFNGWTPTLSMQVTLVAACTGCAVCTQPHHVTEYIKHPLARPRRFATAHGSTVVRKTSRVFCPARQRHFKLDAVYLPAERPFQGRCRGHCIPHSLSRPSTLTHFAIVSLAHRANWVSLCIARTMASFNLFHAGAWKFAPPRCHPKAVSITQKPRTSRSITCSP